MTSIVNLSGLTQLVNSDHRDFSSEQQLEISKVYSHLKQIAKSQRFKIKGNGFNTTALVNEAWLKSKDANKSFNDRQHFFAYCALAMRHILLSQARKNKLITYMGHEDDINEDIHPRSTNNSSDYLLDLEKQLKSLHEYSPRLEQIFCYKFFGEMDFDAIAHVLDVSERTVFRDWKKARAMLSISMMD